MHPGTVAAASPGKPAVIMAGSGEVVTYAELDDRANRAARVLAGAGLVQGDHVAFQLSNEPRFFDLVWAAHRSGLHYTAISTRLTPAETAYIVTDCGARALVVDAGLPAVTEGLPAAGAARRFVAGGPGAPGWEDWDAAVTAEEPTPLPGRSAGNDMLYSSGTTGRPKGIRQALVPDGLDRADGVTALAQLAFGLGPDTVYLSPAPLYHAAPLRFCRAAQRVGATVVVMEHFDPVQFLRLVGVHRATMTQVVPTMFVRMLKLAVSERTGADVSSLRCAVHAAAPCPVEVKQAMLDWWGPIIWEYYAGTEGNGLVLCSPADWLRRPGTVGRPLQGEVHVVDDDGTALPAGEVGTIYFDGGGDFSYHNDPAKTAAAHLPNGWSTLGDVGYLDDAGYLFLTDRKADMIISGGVNVYPAEAEGVLVAHPRVTDAAVFGVPDEEMGEAVKAVVQPAAWDEAGPELAGELIAWCRSRLAHYKCPTSVDFEPELPRAPTGKLYKRLLKDRYWAGRAARIN